MAETDSVAPLPTPPKPTDPVAPPRWTFAPAGCGWLLAVLALDQLHKWWTIFVFKLPLRPPLSVTPFLDLVYTVNKGISFSLLPNLGQKPLIAFALIATLVLIIWIAHASSKLVAISVGLIAGGALSNGIDRMHLDGVADFFSLHAFGFRWYVFNIADCAIVAGVAGLLYDSFVLSRKKDENPA